MPAGPSGGRADRTHGSRQNRPALDPAFQVRGQLLSGSVAGRGVFLKTLQATGFQVGVKGEVFNVTDEQEKITVNNTTWCEAQPGSTACQTARTNYGTATARGSFQAPRNYRLTALVRF